MKIAYIDRIRALSKEKLNPKYLSIANYLLDDQHFAVWSGSAKSEHHHYGDGGLVRHTWEVIHLCFVNKEALGITTIDDNELFLAALFHDAGKLWDYKPTDSLQTPWTGTEHKRLIHHISRSAIYWSHVFNHCMEVTECSKMHDLVLHAILAHHGSREWGSPVAPKTQVAWLLHLCDGISARMDDWNRCDVVKH